MWWNFHGTVLRYAEKNNIWLIASLAAVFAVLFTELPLIDPRNKNYQRFMEYYELFSRFYKGSGREFKPFHKQSK